MPTTLIIGDIHGCRDELMDLLDAAAVPEDVRLVSLGDMVDRGPHSGEVLALFRERAGAMALCGNHERKHLRAARGELRLALAQRITRGQLGGEGYASALDFMGTLPLHLDLGEVMAVHGFWAPGVPLEDQEPMVLAGTMGGERMLVERWGTEWYRHYDGDKPLVVGHRHYRGDGVPLVWRDRVYGLDTGCVHGLRLTGLVLPEFRLVSVPARRNHWAEIRTLHQPEHSMLRVLDKDWEAAWRLIECAKEQTTLPGQIQEQLRDLEDQLQLAEALLVRIHLAVMDELEELLTEVRGGECGEPDTEGRRFARALQERSGVSPLADVLGQGRYASVLHQARRVGPEPERLRGSLRRPAEVLALGVRLGWGEDGKGGEEADDAAP